MRLVKSLRNVCGAGQARTNDTDRIMSSSPNQLNGCPRQHLRLAQHPLQGLDSTWRAMNDITQVVKKNVTLASRVALIRQGTHRSRRLRTLRSQRQGFH